MTIQDKIEERRVYSVDDVADALRLSPGGVRNLIRSGKIHSIKIGCRTLIPVNEFERISVQGC